MDQAFPAIEGIVTRGRQVGRTLGYPTANLAYRRAPEGARDGVYLSRVMLPDGREIPAILNQGAHPTFKEGAKTIEIHLLDFNEDLYGLEIAVRYLAFLRPERKFASPEALKEQLKRDEEAARRILREQAR